VLKICAINPFSGVKVPILIVPRQDQDSFLGIPDICTHHKRWTKEAGILTYKSVLDDNESSGKKLVNSGPELSGLHVDVAREKVMEMAKNIKVGGFWTSSRLKDWLISRQRYWGTPIPIVHCSSCGAVPVPESDLPVVLPVVDSLSVKGRSPLLQAEEWVNTSCPSCGGPGKRETDTLDTFVDSSWYFARYLDPDNKTLPVGKEASKNLPVDLYIGGKEHATLHMYYARFVTHFMHQIGLSPVKEPFQSLLVQGMVKGQSFRVKGSNQYLWPLEVDTTQKPPVEIKTGKPVVAEWEKMSKSKYNGVDPGDILKEYGCDTTRLLILSDVSPQSDRKWNPKDSHVRIQNMQRRIWKLVHHIIDLQQRDDVPELTDDVLAGQVAKIWDARNFYVRVSFNA
jgi:leucyl-tRNA synthetase